MKQFIIIALAAITCVSCTRYKMRATDSSTVEIVNNYDNDIKKGYKAGDTILFRHDVFEFKKEYIILEVIN